MRMDLAYSASCPGTGFSDSRWRRLSVKCLKSLVISSSLVKQYTLIRGVQRERWYLNIKPLATTAFHLVTPTHHPRRRVERRTADVCVTFAGLEDWLLPNHTRSPDLSQFAARIRDHPVPA